MNKTIETKYMLWAEHTVAKAGIREGDLAYDKAIQLALDGMSWQYIAGHFGLASAEKKLAWGKNGGKKRVR